MWVSYDLKYTPPPQCFQLNQSQKRETWQGPWIMFHWVLCWWWKKVLSCFLHMKKLWSYGHVDEVKGDIFHCHSYSQFFLGDLFSAFLATAAAISMQSRGQGWWMVSGMKPDIQDYHNLFCSATIASSLGNHLVIRYSLSFQNQLSSFTFAYSPILFKYE